jgi:hypothetical protein
MQLAAADINGEGTKAAADFKLGIFGIISGEGTIPVGPTGSGRKVNCAEDGYLISRGAGRTVLDDSALP